MKEISRRDFLKYVGAGALGFVAKPKFPFAFDKLGSRASDVVQCFDESATSGTSVNESVVQVMADESIKALTGITNVGEAWKSVFPGITENSIISIKVNCISSTIPTRHEVVHCIINGLTQMNFGGEYYQRNNIIIWDRTDWELNSSGYTIYDGSDPNTVRCFGTNHAGVGYDSTCPLYAAGGTTYPSRILSSMSDYLINVGVLKNHDTAQVTLSMKNNYGSVYPVPSHVNYCNPGIPSVNQQIRDVITPNNVQKIFIIDALFGSVLNGPSGPPNCDPQKLIMSLDTVACDHQGQNIINEERAALGYGAINASHIITATQSPYNLGTTDINLIEINNPYGVEESKTVRPADGILKISPNPFRERTRIFLSLTMASQVYIDLINSAGRIETNIYSGYLQKGAHEISYTVNKRLAAGIYFVRLYSQGVSRIQKVTMLR
ncbi:MAG: DUF362 domain-containing protein [candidate division WOR-3 bacterium]|nr:MAG: DUF362 domain-containing protein [candidate division WOR-3 bacterium]